MNYAFCSEPFQGTIDETIRKLAEIGFDGIEIAPYNVADSVDDVSAKRRAEIRRVAETSGIQIVGLHWLLVSPKGLHITTPDDSLRKKSWDYVESLAHFCADLGGEVMILGSPAQRNLVEGDSLENALERVVEPIRKVGRALSERGVRLLLEPLDPGQTNFLSSVEQAVELAQRVDHPQVGFMLDTRAMSHMDRDILDNIRDHGHAAGHVHVNEPDGVGPGMGDFDFTPVFRELKRVGFGGWISAEPFVYEPDAPTIAETALRTLRAADAAT